MTDPRYALAMDIGGSHVSAAIVDLRERVLVEKSLARRLTTINDPAERLVETWAGAGVDAFQNSGLDAVGRAGVAIPGTFDYAQGISWHTQKFTSLYGQNVKDRILTCWRGTPLQDLPLRFANDAAVWALGEWWLDSVSGNRRVIGVTLGTGLGSGFISEGRIRTAGSDVPPGGEIWNTPYLDGIAENYAAADALTRFYRQDTGIGLTPVEIAARAARGDEPALKVYQEFGAHLASIFLPWVQTFQPDCLVVGGNIARAWTLFRGALQHSLPNLPCRVTEQFENSSLLGAAALEE